MLTHKKNFALRFAIRIVPAAGDNTACDINIYMTQRFLLPMARNSVTGQTVKTQDLTGARFLLSQRRLAVDMADQCAAKMTARSGDLWLGYVLEYTPTERQ